MRKFLFILIIIALLISLFLSPTAKPYISGFLTKLGVKHQPEVKKCTYCDAGYVVCKTCGGDGEATITNCNVCNRPCEIISFLRKTGLSTYYCMKCKKKYTEYVTCSECNGKGHSKCDKCKGTGLILQ